MMIPYMIQIFCKIFENCQVRRKDLSVLGVSLLDPLFELANFLKRKFPSAFELVGHQTIGRVDCIVLSVGPILCVARRLKLQLQCMDNIVLLATGVLSGRHSSLNCSRLYDLKDLS